MNMRIVTTVVLLLAPIGVVRAQEPVIWQEPTCGMPATCAYDCPQRFWINTELLLWWIKDAPLPAPVLTSGLTTDPQPGALGQPSTQILVGGSDVNYQSMTGLRVALGGWNRDMTVGGELNYFFLGQQDKDVAFGSDATPGTARALAIPFIDANTGAESSTFISNPGVFSGSAVFNFVASLQGTEANVLVNLGSREGARLDFITGFRYLNFREELTVLTSSPFLPPNPDVFNTTDQFEASNNFYGGNIGLRGEIRRGRTYTTALAKVALGSMCEQVNINGALATNDFTGFTTVQTIPGGYFALPTNIGSYRRNQFAVVPEFALTFGYKITRHLTASVGYNLLYASNVVRPGDQIDRTINPSEAPAVTGNPPGPLVGPARPAFTFRDTDFWAQGINFGMGWAW